MTISFVALLDTPPCISPLPWPHGWKQTNFRDRLPRRTAPLFRRTPARGLPAVDLTLARRTAEAVAQPRCVAADPRRRIAHVTATDEFQAALVRRSPTDRSVGARAAHRVSTEIGSIHHRSGPPRTQIFAVEPLHPAPPLSPRSTGGLSAASRTRRARSPQYARGCLISIVDNGLSHEILRTHRDHVDALGKEFRGSFRRDSRLDEHSVTSVLIGDCRQSGGP